MDDRAGRMNNRPGRIKNSHGRVNYWTGRVNYCPGRNDYWRRQTSKQSGFQSLAYISTVFRCFRWIELGRPYGTGPRVFRKNCPSLAGTAEFYPSKTAKNRRNGSSLFSVE